MEQNTIAPENGIALCPFPHAEDDEPSDYPPYTTTSTDVNGGLLGHMVTCDYCGASGPSCTTKPEAIRRWNEHAESHAALLSLVQKQREALEAVPIIALRAYKHWDADEDSKVGKILNALCDPELKYMPLITSIHEALALLRDKFRAMGNDYAAAIALLSTQEEQK